jgi:Protein of unknown function DUF45
VPYFPISLEAGIFLRCRGVSGEARFIKLFRRVWERIPTSYRYAMSLFDYDRGRPLAWRIVLRRGKRPFSDAVLGKVARHRMLIRFDSRLIKAPARAARAIIAHELAHVWQYAMAFAGKRWIDGNPPNGKMEEEADLLALLWGFSILDAANWIETATGERPFRGWPEYRTHQRQPGKRYYVPEE